jgi:hypothetical protein
MVSGRPVSQAPSGFTVSEVANIHGIGVEKCYECLRLRHCLFGHTALSALGNWLWLSTAAQAVLSKLTHLEVDFFTVSFRLLA